MFSQNLKKKFEKPADLHTACFANRFRRSSHAQVDFDRVCLETTFFDRVERLEKKSDYPPFKVGSVYNTKT